MKRPREKRKREREGEREREGVGGKKGEIPKESVHGAEKYRQIAHTCIHMCAHTTSLLITDNI